MCVMLLMAVVVIGTAIAAGGSSSSSSSLRKTTNGGVILPTSIVYDDNSLTVVSDNDSRDTTLTMTTSHHSHHHGGSSSHPNDNSNSNNKVGAFDFYVLSMSYQPEFCHENMKEQYTGCQTYNKSWEGQLTIHGLWPNRNDGSYPTQCYHENLTPAHLAGLEISMEQKWPNVKSPTASSSYQSWSMSDTSFWEHEWDKHGTCSNMDQHTYFFVALQLLLPTPTIIKERYDSNSGDSGGSVVTRSELIAGYATSTTSTSKDTVLVCSKHGYLSEVRVCYAKKTTKDSASENGSGSSSGNVGKRISCPDVILKEDNCDETVKIASFNNHQSNVAAIYR